MSQLVVWIVVTLAYSKQGAAIYRDLTASYAAVASERQAVDLNLNRRDFTLLRQLSSICR